MKKITLLFSALLVNASLFANNILVQNVTTTGNNATNKTIQVQFDLSWDNSWRDAINWDAAWVFIKFKNASGVWQHAQLNTTGFANGTGTANTMQVTSDKVGCWVYRSAQGSGTFNNTSMQLQWNYGLSGLTSVTGLEVRVFAVEMVYVPEGEFNCAKKFTGFQYTRFEAPGANSVVINTRLTPSLTYGTSNSTVITLRVKGDSGIDTDNNGTIDNTTYPIGYRHFYCFKYEMTEQQYADFFNTLISSQITNLGGLDQTNITLVNGQYFSSTPNKVFGDPCGGCNPHTIRFLSYADWSGLRPMTFLEFNKASYGSNQPVLNSSLGGLYPAWLSVGTPIGLNNGYYTLQNAGYLSNANSNRASAGCSFFGIHDLTANATEPVVKLNYLNFSSINGNGTISQNGTPDVSNWVYQQTNGISPMLDFLDSWSQSGYWGGCRYVRSAE